jgi:hypothetical protein
MSNCLLHPRERSQKVHKHTEIQSVGLVRWQAATNGTNKIGQSDALHCVYTKMTYTPQRVVHRVVTSSLDKKGFTRITETQAAKALGGP